MTSDNGFTSKIHLQIHVMTEHNKWWNVNDLTEVLRQKCAFYGLKSINHSTVERNIRLYREPRFGLIVEKRKVSDNTYEYRVMDDPFA